LRINAYRCVYHLFLVFLLFFIAVFALFGDLGKTADDYSFHARDPVTGGFSWGDVLTTYWGYFWRPVHIWWCTLIQTVFFHHDWVNHALCVVAHGATCILLYMLARRLLASWQVAVGVAFLFSVYPAAFEVVFWPSTTSTAWGSVCYLMVALLTVGFAQRRSSWWSLAWAMPLAFLAACWYEQPAAAMVSLPLLYLAACPADERAWTRLWRASVWGGMCCASIGGYLVLFILTAPKNSRGGAGSFVATTEELVRKTELVASQVQTHLLKVGRGSPNRGCF
jgi:hypothetical protein